MAPLLHTHLSVAWQPFLEYGLFLVCIYYRSMISVNGLHQGFFPYRLASLDFVSTGQLFRSQASGKNRAERETYTPK